MPKESEFEQFDKAMGTILRADPNTVKAAMRAEIEASKREREARGERKRGRKPKERNDQSDKTPH